MQRFHVSVLYASCVLLLLAGLSGCDVLRWDDSESPLHVAAGRGFEGDWVTIAIDGDIIMADTLTSPEIEDGGMCCFNAAWTEVNLRTRRHSLRVTVNDSLKRNYTFYVQAIRAISVNFDREDEQIEIQGYPEVPIFEG